MNQPFAFGCLFGVAVAWGAVASYLTAKEALSWLPALSVHMPVTGAEATSGPEYVFLASQESKPERPSVAAKVTSRDARYQPLAFGGREGAADASGGAESYLKAYAAGVLSFPARSTHVPLRDALAASGVEYVFAKSHEPMPDSASPPVKLTDRAALNQPFAFGWREGAAVACGSVASYFSWTEAVAELPALSLHAPLTAVEAVSGPV